MYDIDLIKSQITTDNIISILDSFYCPVKKANQNELIFPSICHNRNDFVQHGAKLYYYTASKRFKCYSCNGTWDIFGLIQHLNSCDFISSVKYVCGICGIELSDIGKIQTDSWQSIKKFLPMSDYADETSIIIYEKSVLDNFDKLYHSSWIDDGISIKSMKKFGIGWYARKQAISIPIFAPNGDLIGIRVRFTTDYDIQHGKYRPLSTLNETYKFPTGKTLYGIYENQSAIKQSKSVYLFEGEKSVLKADSWGINNAVACFGHNITQEQIKLLLNLGVTDIVICFDSDYHSIGDEDWKVFKAIVAKTIQKLRPYFSLSVVYNNQGYDGYKFSPVDFDKEKFQKLLDNRFILC